MAIVFEHFCGPFDAFVGSVLGLLLTFFTSFIYFRCFRFFLFASSFLYSEQHVKHPITGFRCNRTFIQLGMDASSFLQCSNIFLLLLLLLMRTKREKKYISISINADNIVLCNFIWKPTIGKERGQVFPIK